MTGVIDPGGDATARREKAARQARHIFTSVEYLVRYIDDIPGPEFDREQRAIFVRLLERAKRQLEVVMWRGEGGCCLSCGASRNRSPRYEHYEDCELARLVRELGEAVRDGK